jgi:hypothetical protein
MHEIVFACDLEDAAPLRGHADGTFLPFHQGFTEKLLGSPGTHLPLGARTWARTGFGADKSGLGKIWPKPKVGRSQPYNRS